MNNETMRALRYHGFPELALENIHIPELKQNTILLKPLAVGIDGTDAHVVAGEFPVVVPIVLGHEIAGVVDKVGKNVTNLKEGDLVCIEPHEYCGLCRYCRIGREHLCVNKKAFGFHLNGGLAEFMLVPEKVVYRAPKGLKPEICCLAEPVSCCVHAMDRLKPISGLGIIIFGAGAAGCILIKLAKLSGLTPIVAVEPQEDRRNMALLFGADFVFNPTCQGWNEQARSITNNDGYDFLVDASGSDGIFEDAIKLTARGACLLIFGVSQPEMEVSIKPYEIFKDELTIVGTAINPYSYHRAVELLPYLGLEHLAIREFPLGECQYVFSVLGRGGKIVINPQK